MLDIPLPLQMLPYQLSSSSNLFFLLQILHSIVPPGVEGIMGHVVNGKDRGVGPSVVP